MSNEISAIRLLKLNRGIRGSGPLLSPLSLLLTSLFHADFHVDDHAFHACAVSREDARPSPGAIPQRAAQDRQHAASISEYRNPVPFRLGYLHPDQEIFHRLRAAREPDEIALPF